MDAPIPANTPKPNPIKIPSLEASVTESIYLVPIKYLSVVFGQSSISLISATGLLWLRVSQLSLWYIWLTSLLRPTPVLDAIFVSKPIVVVLDWVNFPFDIV